MHEQTINDLKAKAYDLIAEIDHYNAAIGEVRGVLSKINQQIQKKLQEAELSKPAEEKPAKEAKETKEIKANK